VKLHVPDWLVQLLSRPADVLGAGVSGRAAAELVRALGGTAVIYDRANLPDARQQFLPEDATGHGLVIVSPGFASDHEWLRTARDAGCEVLAELDLAALAWPGEIIAVTGTNGKTTLTEFLTHALRLAGRDARAAGNIGEAFCSACLQPATHASVAVCEVSSFQAEALRFFQAATCLWTNFAEDHLERHGSLESYFAAKYQLVRRTTDGRVYSGPTVLDHARRFGRDLPADGCVSYDFAAGRLDPRVAPTPFGRNPQRENYLLVEAAWRDLGLHAETLVEAALSFRPGPHRLAKVGDVRGVAFWNDSKATNFHAAEAALEGFGRPVLWIGGGRSKGGDVGAFVARITPRLRHAFVIGETGAELAAHLHAASVPVARCETLRDAVVAALAAAVSGDSVLLSPAFASFDMFRGYDDRGRCFESIVAGLAAEKRGTAPSILRQSQASELLSLL
jgi:UDP-N-acetylmuramoylalanine--D-glutamate ligase